LSWFSTPLPSAVTCGYNTLKITNKNAFQKEPVMYHPYADLIGLKIDMLKNGQSRCSLEVDEKLFNPHQVVHGAVLYSLADTGMGAALYPGLKKGEICATIEIKINYYHPVKSGTITCKTKVINRGKSVANLESSIYSGKKRVAQANGNYSIFTPNTRKKEPVSATPDKSKKRKHGADSND
jgi:acyl-CoA thioesterase